ncbi:putative membrane protein YdbT with pleckstrin-like domain [Erwinia toletana]|uniref:Membrane protein YdbT with pleckstrin-like domain n=1 Tax=Winslowiella toletana TaxID=92490 RepID=A0ABS4PE15_9GAMM|nr:hypothetical protein [Winslowiella toletana]MBP2170847.1 putative membrane protein YdbT with pleckstrin-like domain [Winslowiella toletana]
MIVWNGFGFFIAVFISLAYLFCKWLFNTLWQADYYSAHHWTIGVTMLLASLLSALFVWWLTLPSTQLFISRFSGAQSMQQPLQNHSFFFIPIAYWSIILFLLGLGLCIYDLKP